jgi:iron complex transport system permease protein
MDFNMLQIIFKLRVFSVLTAIFSAIGLSMIGLYLQTLFQNPLASPFTLGISPIASLYTSILIFFSSSLGYYFHFEWSSAFVFFLQILFSLFGAYFMLFFIQKIIKRNINQSLIILTGILIGTFSGAIQQFIESYMSNTQLKQNFMWNLGSFDILESYKILILCFNVIMGYIFLFRIASQANMYLLGTQYAQNLGLDVTSFTNKVVWIASIVVAVITAITGPIGFLGLIAPHIAKMILKDNRHENLLIFTSFVASSIALICLFMSHIEYLNQIISINIILSILGVPFTLFLLFRQNKA